MKYKGDVLVITGVPLAHQSKSNVLHGTSVEGPTIVLVNKENLPIVFTLKHPIKAFQ
jgi:hypothetical protein